ncbi:hypothetical protein HOA92_00095 [archaeon]|jgi:phosphate uptake regulator|nr:hypothetical protein [archaeon]MBT6761420.1 hypothetical protein [archaeon]
MKRKIIGQGKGGATISLPIHWVRSQNLKAGDEVDVSFSASGLLIGAKQKVSQKKIEIDGSDWDTRLTKIHLNALYTKGYSKILIKNAKVKLVRLMIKELIGVEITKIKGKNLVLETLTEPTGDRRLLLEKQIHHTIIDALDLIIQSIEMKNKKMFSSEIEEYTKKVNRFSVYCQRELQMENPSHEHYFLWTYYTDLRIIQRNLLKVFDKNLLNDKNLVEGCTLIQDYYQNFLKMRKIDLKWINKEYDKINKLILSSKMKNSEIRYLLVYSLRKLFRCVINKSASQT